MSSQPQAHQALDLTADREVRPAPRQSGECLITERLALVHAENGWALWSDGELTSSAELPEPHRPQGPLSPTAVELISSTYHATYGAVHLEGSYTTLACVAEALAVELIEQGHTDGPYARPRLLRYDVRMVDGTERSLWVATRGEARGYRYDICDTLDEAAALAHAPTSRRA